MLGWGRGFLGLGALHVVVCLVWFWFGGLFVFDLLVSFRPFFFFFFFLVCLSLFVCFVRVGVGFLGLGVLNVVWLGGGGGGGVFVFD